MPQFAADKASYRRHAETKNLRVTFILLIRRDPAPEGAQQEEYRAS